MAWISDEELLVTNVCFLFRLSFFKCGRRDEHSFLVALTSLVLMDETQQRSKGDGFPVRSQGWLKISE